MNIKDFDFYKQLLRKKSGLYLSSEKVYLLNSRLTPVAKNWGFDSLEMMTIGLRGFPDNKMLKDVIEAMTFHDTSFFREQSTFHALRNELIGTLLKTKNGPRQVNFWCAGCSTGQEAYSLSITLDQEPAKQLLSSFRVKIDASDLSNTVIEKAKTGTFTQLEVQDGMPVTLMMEYFNQDEKTWTAKPKLKDPINFFQQNLIDNMPSDHKYDFIFCRYVMQDFDYEAQEDILRRFAERLMPNGYLVLGMNETIPENISEFKPLEKYKGFYNLS